MPSAGSHVELSVAEAARLIHHEVRLLDEGALEAWLDLFTADGIYWLPIGPDEADPESTISNIYDDAQRRSERVFRLLHTPVPAQTPPSRTAHLVTNVEVEPDGDGRDEVVVRCNQLIAEIRPGGPLQLGLGQQNLYVARCLYRFRHEADAWRIALKRVHLVNADRPIGNLTFMV